MSRSGYCDDIDNWELIKWRGMVASAIRGQRGQVLLRDMMEALDSMPTKRLIAHNLIANGEVCALGAVGIHRNVKISDIDPDDYEHVAAIFDISECLVREIAYNNDEKYYRQTPEQRWQNMREWVAHNLK